MWENKKKNRYFGDRWTGSVQPSCWFRRLACLFASNWVVNQLVANLCKLPRLTKVSGCSRLDLIIVLSTPGGGARPIQPGCRASKSHGDPAKAESPTMICTHSLRLIRPDDSASRRHILHIKVKYTICICIHWHSATRYAASVVCTTETSCAICFDLV